MKSIALCMIVRDEEARLARCLESVSGAVEEMIIVDTGSTDRTVEIAQAFHANVLFHEWNGDFSAARNLGLDAASSEYILVLDADEYLDNPSILQEDLASSADYYLLPIRNQMSGGASYLHAAPRLFRNAPQNRFREKIHEFVKINMATTRTGKTLIHHDGYLKEVYEKKDKNRRNLDILVKLAEESPTGYNLFNLARQYRAYGDFERAADYFEMAYEKSRNVSILPNLLLEYAISLNELNRCEDGILILQSSLSVYPNYTEMHYLLGEFYDKLGYKLDAVICWKKCMSLGETEYENYAKYGIAFEGTGSYLPAIRLAEYYLKQRQHMEAFDLIVPLLADKRIAASAIKLYLSIAREVKLPTYDQFDFLQSVVPITNGNEALDLFQYLYQARSPLLQLYLDKYNFDPDKYMKAGSQLYAGLYSEAAALFKQIESPPIVDLFAIALLLKDSVLLQTHKDQYNFSQREWKSLRQIVEGSSEIKAIPESMNTILLEAGRMLYQLNELSTLTILMSHLRQGSWDVQYQAIELLIKAGLNDSAKEQLVELTGIREVPDKFHALLAKLSYTEGNFAEVREIWTFLRKKYSKLDYSTYVTSIDLFDQMGERLFTHRIATDMVKEYPYSDWAKSKLH